MSTPQFGRLRLSVQGTNNGRGFDILYDFGESFNFVEATSKKEFSFIQPWIQFPVKKYTEECMRVSIELVRRFNEFPELETQNKRWEESVDSLIKERDKLRREIDLLRFGGGDPTPGRTMGAP